MRDGYGLKRVAYSKTEQRRIQGPHHHPHSLTRSHPTTIHAPLRSLTHSLTPITTLTQTPTNTITNDLLATELQQSGKQLFLYVYVHVHVHVHGMCMCMCMYIFMCMCVCMYVRVLINEAREGSFGNRGG